MSRSVPSLHCAACGWQAGVGLPPYRCPSCARALSYPAPERAFPLDAIAARPAEMWRYAEALPDPGDAGPVRLGEAVTPLVPLAIDGLEDAGLQVLVKVETGLPSGSYKDRGAATLIGYLRSLGVAEAVEDSSGNAGAAMAAYAARTGLQLKVFCPDSASPGKLRQIAAHGAELVPVPGPRPRATEALLEYVDAHPETVYASHLWHPVFLEGVRTMAWEIAEQLQWQLPDWVVCPVGAGSILLGLRWGFEDLLRAGVVAGPVPRLLAVQARNRAAVVTAFERGDTRATAPDTGGPPTLAEGIAVPAPVRDAEVLAALRTSDGAAVAVSEEQIADGAERLARAGFYVEPTSAVVWHGLLELHARQPLAPGSTVVAVLSGHGLKSGA